MQVKIYDLFGKLLNKTKTVNNKLTIDLKAIKANKMIFVKVISNGKQTVRKIIVR